eukprot:ANDGO_00455.mRNA.1 hypothetical protein
MHSAWSPWRLLLVGVFGIAGVLLRQGAMLLFGPYPAVQPLVPVLLVNILASFCIGALHQVWVSILLPSSASSPRSVTAVTAAEHVLAGLSSGFLGGLSTFSSFSNGCLMYLSHRVPELDGPSAVAIGVVYGIASPVLGVAALVAGIAGAKTCINAKSATVVS